LHFSVIKPVFVEFDVEVDAAEAKFTVLVTESDVAIGHRFEGMQETEKGLGVHALCDQLLLLCNIEVGLRFYEVTVRAQIAQSRSAVINRTFKAEEFLPEGVAGEVRRQRLYEDPVVVPQQMEARVFRDHNLSSSDDLIMQRRDIVTSRGRNEPEDRVESVQMVVTEVTCQEFEHLILIGY
jgi:hypothetical protein